jgi:hypothetical protein
MHTQELKLVRRAERIQRELQPIQQRPERQKPKRDWKVTLRFWASIRKRSSFWFALLLAKAGYTVDEISLPESVMGITPATFESVALVWYIADKIRTV